MTITITITITITTTNIITVTYTITLNITINITIPITKLFTLNITASETVSVTFTLIIPRFIDSTSISKNIYTFYLAWCSSRNLVEYMGVGWPEYFNQKALSNSEIFTVLIFVTFLTVGTFTIAVSTSIKLS